MVTWRLERRKKEEYTEAKSVIKFLGLLLMSLFLPVVYRYTVIYTNNFFFFLVTFALVLYEIFILGRRKLHVSGQTRQGSVSKKTKAFRISFPSSDLQDMK
jgi:hypothetical protein